jgi:hypothetical protein
MKNAVFTTQALISYHILEEEKRLCSQKMHSARKGGSLNFFEVWNPYSFVTLEFQADTRC